MLSASAEKWSVVGRGSRNLPERTINAAITGSRLATSAAATEKLVLGTPSG